MSALAYCSTCSPSTDFKYGIHPVPCSYTSHICISWQPYPYPSVTLVETLESLLDVRGLQAAHTADFVTGVGTGVLLQP